MVPPLPGSLDQAHETIRRQYAGLEELTARNEELAREKGSLVQEKESLVQEKESLVQEKVLLAARNEALAREKQSLAARAAELERQIAWFQKQIFGQKSERRTSDPAAADALTEDLFGSMPEATPEEIREETSEPAPPPRRHRGGRKPLPAELPRREILHDAAPGEKVCPCCGKEKARIGEDVTEQLEVIPAQVYVARHVRPKYACPSCKDGVCQAALPAQPAPRASAGPGFLAWLIVSKYADHLPLCRLERIFARHGVDLSRARMCDWLMTAGDLTRPLVRAMRNRVRAGPVIQADETSIRLQSKENKGKTVVAWAWVYAGGEEAPYTVFDFRTSRGRDGPREMLEGFEGTLQCDGYAAYENVGAAGKIVRAGCWAHARRGFLEAEQAADPRAKEALALIRKLFDIEREGKRRREEAMAFDEPAAGGGAMARDAEMARPERRGPAPEARRLAERERLAAERRERQAAGRERWYEERRALRREKSAPVLDALRIWMSQRLDVLPRSPLGQAIGYTQNQWAPLTRFLDDGRVELDNNAAERALRPIAVGRKNWLFAGSERGGRAAATFFSLVESARRNGVNPFDYLRNVLERLPSHPINRIDDFLPDLWKPFPPA